MNTQEMALVTIMSAVAVVVSYGKGLATSFLPGLIEFTTVIIFVSGFCFGTIVGGAVGMLSMTIKMLVPYPFAHPASWIFTISPLLLAVEALLGGMYGVVGSFLGKKWSLENRWRFTLKLSLSGFILTLIYQIFSSIGFYLAYPVYPSVWGRNLSYIHSSILLLPTNCARFYKSINLCINRHYANICHKKTFHSEQEDPMMTRGTRRTKYKMEDAILLLLPKQNDRRLRVNDIRVAPNGFVHHLVQTLQILSLGQGNNIKSAVH